MRKLFWQISGLAAALARHGLIDDYRVLTRLRLLKAETWASGVVALFYRALGESPQ